MATEPAGDRRRPAAPSDPFPAGRRLRAHVHHPDAELLDAFAGGEPLPRSVREHIEGCVSCQESMVALRRVRTDLSRLAALTMPGEVAERLQAALAAHAPAPSRPGPGRNPAAPTGPGPASSGFAGTTGAAGATGTEPLVGDTEAVHTEAVHTDPGDGTGGRAASGNRPRRRPGRGGAGAGLTDHQPARRRDPRSRPGASGARPRRDWVSIMAVCIAFITFGAAIFVYHGLRSANVDHRVAASNPVDSSGPAGGSVVAERGSASSAPLIIMAVSQASVAPSDVVRHGRELLAGRILGSAALPLVPPPAPAAAGGATTPATVDVDRLRSVLDTPGLRPCYQSLAAQTGGTILAVDRVVYNDQPALLIVLSVPMQPAVARVLVVDARCGITTVSTAPWYSVSTLRH